MADSGARATASNERCTDRILGFGLGRCFREQGKREAATDSQDDLEQSFGSGPWTRCFAWKMLLSSQSGAAWYMAMNVGDWLRSLGLGKYEATFRDSEIDSDILHELTESDLEKLGLPLGHRKAPAQGDCGSRRRSDGAKHRDAAFGRRRRRAAAPHGDVHRPRRLDRAVR